MEQRVKKLEENLLQFSNHLSEMRSDLKYIKENISEYKDIKSTTITHTEQIKTLFNNHADQKKQLD
jgi:hypothetical protein